MNTKELDIFFSNFFNLEEKELKKIKRGESFEWDSMKHVDLILTLEKKFKLKIKPKEISKIESYQDILNLIDEKR